MKKGVFLHGNNFYLKVLDRQDDKKSLFSFVVPAKIIKTSVGRHQIKRKMTAVVEKVLNKIKPSLSILMFLKKDVSHLPYSAIEKEILILLSKVLHSVDDR